MKSWKSIAVWPDKIGLPNNQSEDEHDTEGQAEGVCRLLEREGFGGEGKIFPIMTIVEATDCSENKKIQGKFK